ncbi:hypothetical protein UFOVP1302_44 [uncultured Caudovirales phage]|uniref:Uncharacterized protein n=1 Tax=uncultured Caudovirales phage TaxID=2100421 RepID=A0A6J5QGI9_9CAUD|nr:hypothetical protein UFOVP895_47 [uncultured Caudovirales phage]CAB4181476.1 hypothetical protein UFOVP1070_40 [uncultured Caudovirales phage]CAB4195940.1 hypothetical protein UFOVP1302_44 [uncultured Caudovirales phage]CAB4211924.1 hypothetical protein UFOVP1416_68 [uncultured Caudovirales phage]
MSDMETSTHKAEAALAYVKDGKLIMAIHGDIFGQDYRTILEPEVALKLAECLVRAVNGLSFSKKP